MCLLRAFKNMVMPVSANSGSSIGSRISAGLCEMGDILSNVRSEAWVLGCAGEKTGYNGCVLGCIT